MSNFADRLIACRDAGKVYAVVLESMTNFHAIFDFKVSQSLIGCCEVRNRLKFNRICRQSTISKEADTKRRCRGYYD